MATIGTIIASYWKHWSEQENDVENVTRNLYATLYGSLTFIAVICVFQFVFMLFKICAHHRLANYLGFLTVTCASLLASKVVMSTREIMSGLNHTYPSHYIPLCTAISLIYFLCLAWNFKCVLPSSLLHRGAFAERDLPQADYNVAITKRQRTLTQGFGYRYGCHSCGIKHFPFVRAIVKFYCNFSGTKAPYADYHADHSPPFAIAKHSGLNEGCLLPHCHSCSNYQSSCVKKAIKDDTWEEKSIDHIVTHSTRLRLWKVWLPWPIILHQNLHVLLYNLVVNYVTDGYLFIFS